MNQDAYVLDPEQASAFARLMVDLTPTGTSAVVAIGGALTYATALAFEDPALATRAANAMRLMAADLDRRAATLAAH